MTSLRVLVIASATIAALLPTVPAIASPPPTGRHRIANANSGLCLSPAGGTANRNEQTVQFLCDADLSRAWTIEPVEGNVVKIRNVKSRQCLTVAGGRSDRNAPSVQFPCDNDPSRRWLYAPSDDGLFRLVNLQSGLCLTIAGGGTGRNDVAVQFPCDADPSRFFKLQ